MAGSGKTSKNNKPSQRVRDLLDDCLSRHFGVSDAKFHRFIEDNCEYLDVHTGDVLIRQNAICDDVYFLLSGRMRALVKSSNGDQIPVGEIGRGETVGELAMFTGERRSADVVAIRDSLVVKVSRETLEKAMGKQPAIAMNITKNIIERFKNMDAKNKPPRIPVSLTFLPITSGIDAYKIVEELAKIRRAKGDEVAIVDANHVRSHHGPLEGADISLPRGPVSLALGDMELNYDAIYLIAEPEDQAWCRTAIYHSDEVVILADAQQPATLSKIEIDLFADDVSMRARMTLALLHAPDVQKPNRDGEMARASVY